MNNTKPPAFIRRMLLCSSLALLGGRQVAQADFALKANDRVVFYGDSITEQHFYTTFVETYILTRFPKLPVSFVNSGWGGDRVTGGGGGPIDVRLQRDVLPYHPTVMTIMLGMNDGAYRAFDDGIFNTYTTGYAHILDTVKTGVPGVRVTLIQPSPYDDVTRAPGFAGGYNGVLQRYAGFLNDTATQRNLTLTDFNTPVVAMLQKANGADATTAQQLIPDRIHPRAPGSLIMAESLLKTWGAPAVVSDVSIDAAAKRTVRADNTQISDLRVGPALSWTQNDAALPFPLDTGDPQTALVLKSSDFVDALDREPLQVTGLQAPVYTLSIDGDQIGDFRREELAQGINLALLPTPMHAQAADVHRLTLQHNDQHFWRWRNVQIPLEGHSDAVKNAEGPLLQALDGEEAQTVAQQRAAAQPKPHHFELTVAAPEPTGPNLALHQPYVVSDPNVYGYGTGALTDGSWSGEQPHTFATGEVNTFPKTVTIDLGAVRPVSLVRLGVPGFGSTKTIKVSVSGDGQTFTDVGTHVFALATERRYSFNFAPVPTRYVRLTYPDHYDDNVGYSPLFSFTTEVEAYSPTP